ncbi:MAG: hypothetical protein JWQ90_1073 [Hydrocarboniphaga sp.]|nr:hypothetical protein [Hydrocarboniphaga sp.]
MLTGMDSTGNFANRFSGFVRTDERANSSLTRKTVRLSSGFGFTKYMQNEEEMDEQ